MRFTRDQEEKDRAAKLRQNRQKKSARPTDAAKKPVSTSTTRKSSPVVIRSSSYGQPLRRPVGTQPRKKVVYRVGAHGVETRLPAIPIVKFSWQWVSGLLTIVLLVLALTLPQMDAFKVNAIDIQGLQRVKLEDVQPVIQSNSESVITMDRSKVLIALAIAFPELNNIQLQVSLPNKITVSAQERQPILAWKTGKNTVWVDSEGMIMPVRGEAGTLVSVKATGKPFIKSPASQASSLVNIAEQVLQPEKEELTPDETFQYLDKRVLTAAMQLSSLLPQGTALVYDPVAGMGWRDPGGWRVYFGNDLSDIEFKKIEYQAIIDELTRRGIKPTMVSVENVDSPYFRTD